MLYVQKSEMSLYATLSEVYDAIGRVELQSAVKFVRRHTSKNFGQIGEFHAMQSTVVIPAILCIVDILPCGRRRCCIVTLLRNNSYID